MQGASPGVVRKALGPAALADPASPIQGFSWGCIRRRKDPSGQNHPGGNMHKKHGKIRLFVVSVKTGSRSGLGVYRKLEAVSRGRTAAITHYISAQDKGILELEGRVDEFGHGAGG